MMILELFDQFITFNDELGFLAFEYGAVSEANHRLGDLKQKLNVLSSSFGDGHIIVKKLRLRFESTHKCLELLSTLFDIRLEKRQVTNTVPYVSERVWKGCVFPP